MNHHKYCPMAGNSKSTFCACSELDKALSAANKEPQCLGEYLALSTEEKMRLQGPRKKEAEDCNCEGGDGYSERPFKCETCRAKDERECLRCHSLAPYCRCAPGKEQLV